MSLQFGKKKSKQHGDHTPQGVQTTSNIPPVGPEDTGTQTGVIPQNGPKPEKKGLGGLFGKKQAVRAVSNPKDWNFRAELIPPAVVRRNKDRVIRNAMIWVDVAVVIVIVLVTILMMGLVRNAENHITEAQNKYQALVQQKKQYQEVEDTLNAVSDEQMVSIGVLYNEVDWKKVAEQLNASLPDNGLYNTLDMSEYQLVGSGSKTSGSTNGTVWSSGGVITVNFTVADPDFIKAQDFIEKYRTIDGFVDGAVTSITGGDGKYTYTGSVTLHLITTKDDGSEVKNTTARGDSSAGVEDTNRQLLAQLRQQLEDEAAGKSTTSTSTATGKSSDSTSTSTAQ